MDVLRGALADRIRAFKSPIDVRCDDQGVSVGSASVPHVARRRPDRLCGRFEFRGSSGSTAGCREQAGTSCVPVIPKPGVRMLCETRVREHDGLLWAGAGDRRRRGLGLLCRGNRSLTCSLFGNTAIARSATGGRQRVRTCMSMLGGQLRTTGGVRPLRLRLPRCGPGGHAPPPGP